MKKDASKELKNALNDVKRILTKTGKNVSKDFGKFKVKYKEGIVVKKARLDLSKGLSDLAKKLRISAKKIRKD